MPLIQDRGSFFRHQTLSHNFDTRGHVLLRRTLLTWCSRDTNWCFSSPLCLPTNEHSRVMPWNWFSGHNPEHRGHLVYKLSCSSITTITKTDIAMNTTFFNDTLIAFEAQWAFVSNTSDEDYKRLVREHLTIEVFFLYFIFVTGSATNLFLLLHIASQTRQKSGSHVLLINLVIVDLLLIVFKIFPDIIWCQTVSWEVGELACKLVNFIGHFSLYSSCYLVVCISYNRYNLLKEPHIFHKEKQRAYRMLKIAYLFSGFLSLPQVSDYFISWITFDYGVLCLSVFYSRSQVFLALRTFSEKVPPTLEWT